MTPIPVAALRILARHGFRLPPTLANNGTPSHPAIRAIVAEALHPARVAEQRPWLTGLVRRRVMTLQTRLRAGEPVDLYADLAADLPLLVLARLVALPADDVAVVKRFSRAALELFWAPVDPDRQRNLARIVGRYHAVLRRFAASGPGLVARLRAAGHGPDVLTGALFFLLVAGQETTSQFLTLLMHRLIIEPAALSARLPSPSRLRRRGPPLRRGATVPHGGRRGGGRDGTAAAPGHGPQGAVVP
jgi:cytochrome P450